VPSDDIAIKIWLDGKEMRRDRNKTERIGFRLSSK
jgi:hypothetical protein